MDRPLSIQVDRRGDAAVVTLDGSCSMEVSDQLKACLVGLANERVPLVVLDMTRLDFIDSMGLGGIIAAHLRSRFYNGFIRLVGPRKSIREVLELTRLTRLFPVDATVDAALATGLREVQGRAHIN